MPLHRAALGIFAVMRQEDGYQRGDLLRCGGSPHDANEWLVRGTLFSHRGLPYGAQLPFSKKSLKRHSKADWAGRVTRGATTDVRS